MSHQLLFCVATVATYVQTVTASYTCLSACEVISDRLVVMASKSVGPNFIT